MKTGLSIPDASTWVDTCLAMAGRSPGRVTWVLMDWQRQSQCPIANTGKELFKGEFQGCIGGGREGAYMLSRAVSSDNHLEIGHAGV